MRELVTGDNPILKTKCKEVTFPLSGETAEFITQMWEIMRKDNGVGLAANQLGQSLRIITIDTTGSPRGISALMINPVIEGSFGVQVGPEGCLSFPGKTCLVSRPKSIVVTYQDVAGRQRKKTLMDLSARAVCHEIDHLDGVTFMEKDLNK